MHGDPLQLARARHETWTGLPEVASLADAMCPCGSAPRDGRSQLSGDELQRGRAWRGQSEGTRFRVHYTGTLDNGEQFDSSRGMDPLYLHAR